MRKVTEAEGVSMAGAKHRKTVLVVDDDAATRRLVTMVLSKRYAVLEAGDALAATDLLARGSATVDLLICDVMMPIFDGFSLVKSLRAEPRLKGLEVIFISGKTAP